MECPPHVKALLESLADSARYCRFVNKTLNEEFEKMGVDTTSKDFVSAFAYVEGDCDTSIILSHIEEL